MHLSVGGPWAGEIPGQDCWQFIYAEGGYQLTGYFASPSSDEIEQVRRGRLQLALYVRLPAIILLHRFGRMAWSDCPFSWWLIPPDDRVVPAVPAPGDPGMALLRVLLIDRTQARVCAIRAVTMSRAMTRAFARAIIAQSQQPAADLAGFDAQLAKIFAQYPNPASIAAVADVACIAGQDDGS